MGGAYGLATDTRLATRNGFAVRNRFAVRATDAPPRKPLNKKTYNNIVIALRCAFEYGYRDLPEKHNPALIENAADYETRQGAARSLHH